MSPPSLSPQPIPHSPATLKATYTSPTTSQTFTHALPSASVQSTQEKTAYLSALRNSVIQLQEDMNAFLTSKMEEDKVMVANAGVKVDEKVEEENYGEDKVEDEG